MTIRAAVAAAVAAEVINAVAVRISVVITMILVAYAAFSAVIIVGEEIIGCCSFRDPDIFSDGRVVTFAVVPGLGIEWVVDSASAATIVRRTFALAVEISISFAAATRTTIAMTTATVHQVHQLGIPEADLRGE